MIPNGWKEPWRRWCAEAVEFRRPAVCGRHCRVASRWPRAEYNGERRIGLLTPVFAQSSPHRSRESAAVVRSFPIQIGPPSSSEGRERTVFPCLRDRRTGTACTHYVCHTIWRKLRVFRDFLRIFRRKSPTFYSFLPVFRRLLSCARTLSAPMVERCSRSPLRRVLSGPAADRFGE